MAAVPAWQTDELGEEWVETSPSPPGSPPADASTHDMPIPSHASLSAKRGSLRSLGQAPARPLPPSRKTSAAGPEYARSPSNPYVRSASGMLSPPTSVSGSEGDSQPQQRQVGKENSPPAQPQTASVPSESAAGTFLVKEDVEDVHGKAFPKNPFGVGKDMFTALALERMFEPPTPPAPGRTLRDNNGDSMTIAGPSALHKSMTRSPEPDSSAAEVSPLVQSPLSDKPASDRSESAGSMREISAGSIKSLSTSPEVSLSPTPSPAGPPVERRVSHAYAPTNPSRLCKSVTPSDSSFATTEATTHDNTLHSNLEDDTVHSDRLPPPFANEQTEHPHEHEPEGDDDQYESMVETTVDGSIDDLASPPHSPEQEDHADLPESPLTDPRYPFTFTAPVQHDQATPEFDPPLAPLEGGEPAHSTLRLRPASTNLGLRLFRNTYDTVTREHLSALVDSIAIQPSPSPPPSVPDARDLRDWSPTADDQSPVRSNSTGTMSTPSNGSGMSDARSSKRLRLSPPSPRGPTAVRDWRAQGAALMNRIRVTDPEMSQTSDSRSATRSWDSRDMGSRSGSRSWEDSRTREEFRSATFPTEGESAASGSAYYGMPTVDYGAVPPTPPTELQQEAGFVDEFGTYHRSNPSTASSTYLHRAEDVMSRIKQRMVSPSTSTVESSEREARRALSQSSTQTWTSSDAEPRVLRAGARPAGPSPRRLPRRLSASDEIKRIEEEIVQSSDDDEVPPPNIVVRSPERPVSRTSLQGSGQPPGQNREDLNRFMSASTYATATTVSTSFVKHRGPRDPALQPNMTHILPGDVHGVVPDRIGKMRFDHATMRWVREPQGLGRVDEMGESRTIGSDESADPFAGFESVGSMASPERPIQEASISSSDEVEEQEEDLQASMRTVQTVDDWDQSEDLELPQQHEEVDLDATPRPPARQQHALRPPVVHSNSAPTLRTPTPATPGTTPPGPLRSALRNPNSTPASALKKQTAWHPDLTPAPDNRYGSVERSVSYRRSVSFSDQYIAPPRDFSGSRHKRQLSAERDLFSENDETNATNASWLPSARTRRIQGVLDEMADLSLADDSPSKPPSREPTVTRKQIQQQQQEAVPESGEESEDTIPLSRFRSFRSYRGTSRRADATFLTECSFGVAHDRLVQLITDVQPFEPYWENLRSIDLSNKGVESLARLKEFLPALDEARLSDNMIDYLSGIPSTVRTLHVAGNQLSSLTSVNHLRNLQYLDISRNQLDSVAQLECLTHLRELNADNNAITDLTGILAMDSLLKLSVAGNKLERIDFDQAKWGKLETLNLSNNRISSVKGLHRLTSATSINLDKNRLVELDPACPLTVVRILRVSDNDISHLDLSHFPKVRTLFADGNSLPGLSRSMSTGGHRIENLSLRNQRVGRLALTPEDLQSVKRLYLSGNRLDPDFLPPNPLFNLVYLEAAACNLTSWPADLAARVPNLRILNVNYNFLPDLDGLDGLAFIRKLMAVGNRLGGGSKGGAVRGLKGLSSLEEVDLRMNPSTLSFYLPILLPRTKGGSSSGSRDKDKDRAASDGVVPDNWPAMDAQFRRQLPDEWYSKRLVYRGLVMAACPELRLLDGIRVEQAEKRKAAMLLEYASEASLQ